MKHRFIFFRKLWIVIGVLYAVTASAQEKRIAAPEDYRLWSETDIGIVSPCGNYFTYTLHYPTGQDTLVVRSTRDKKNISIATGRFGKFSNAGLFACYRGNELLLLEIESGRLTSLGSTTSFDFSPSGKYLISKTENSLKIFNRNGADIVSLDNVYAWTISPSEDRIAYSTSQDGLHTILLANLGTHTPHKLVISRNDRQFKNLSWSEDGHSLAYASYTTEGTVLKEVGIFNSINQKTFHCSMESLLNNKAIHYDRIIENGLKITPDANLVYIQLEVLGTQMPKEDVQVWNTFDTLNFRQSELKAQYGQLGLACWDIPKNSITMVSTLQLPSVMQLGANFVLWNPFQYEPQFDYTGPVDYYISDHKGENRKLILEKQDPYAGHFLPSPNGSFIAYYKDKQWSLYEVATGKHLPISKGSTINFENTLYDMPGESGACGFAGWYDNEQGLIVYDEYDLWEYNLKKAVWKRLTKGREKQIHFRIAGTRQDDFKTNYNGYQPRKIKEKRQLVLSAAGADGNTGYYILNERGQEKVLYYGSAQIDQLKVVKDGYICRQQRFDSPKSFYYLDSEGNQKLLARSNRPYDNFIWGREEAIYYTDSQGNSLKGILYYPPGYDPSKKYPMIVSIYQRQFSELHTFRLPTAGPDNGFDLVSFLNAGYIVLLPDIHYNLGEPGASALRCTLAGVKNVVDKGSVDPARIGLIGHSFGGYETNYIVTHSDVFAAAVSGAAANDLISFYLTLNWDTGRPDMWRMEYQQLRMGQPYYDDTEKYLGNSPISAAKNLTTPLLSWVGQKDYQVNWQQSVELYLALRRLKKRHTLLIYPEEGHHIAVLKNREDLFVKVSAWFGHYLKNEKAPLWMEHK